MPNSKVKFIVRIHSDKNYSNINCIEDTLENWCRIILDLTDDTLKSYKLDDFQVVWASSLFSKLVEYFQTNCYYLKISPNTTHTFNVTHLELFILEQSNNYLEKISEMYLPQKNYFKQENNNG